MLPVSGAEQLQASGARNDRPITCRTRRRARLTLRTLLESLDRRLARYPAVCLHEWMVVRSERGPAYLAHDGVLEHREARVVHALLHQE